MLTEFGTHVVELLLHSGVVLPRISDCFFEKVYVVDCPRERFPFAGLVGLAGGQTEPEIFEAVLHFTATFALGELMGNTQFRGAAVRRAARWAVLLANQVAHCFVL